MRGARGAQCAATWHGAMRPCGSTWAPVWGATWQVGLADRGPTRIVGPGKRGGAVTQLSHMTHGGPADVGCKGHRVKCVDVVDIESTRSPSRARAQLKD